MMTRHIGATLAVMVCVFALVLAPAAMADTKLVTHVHNEGYQSQGMDFPTKDDTTTFWISDKAARVDQGDTASFVFYGDKEMMIMLNHRDKSYTEVPIGAFSKLIEEQAGGDSTALVQAKGMLEMLRVKAKVTPTKETQKIGDYNCKKYILEIEIAMTTAKTEAWVTEDVAIDYDLYSQTTQAMKAFLPGFDDAVKEMSKMKGVQVRTSTSASMMGVERLTTTELLAVEQLDTAAGFYDVPKDYTKSELELPGQ